MEPLQPFEFFGDPSPLTETDFAENAERLRCDVPAIKTVYAVESAGRGHYADRRCIILSEPHKFSRFTAGRFDESFPELSYPDWRPGNYPPNRAEPRYGRLTAMMALDETAALKATSWGAFQIMGFNRGLCGFDTVQDFVAFSCESQAHQLECFVRFLIATGLDDELREHEWRSFAHAYNGPGQVDKYERWLSDAYAKAAAVDEEDPDAEAFPVSDEELAERPDIPTAHFITPPPREEIAA